ncbi:DUF4360 domain-containing protein [Sorangium sp. So ce1036]|uniref:DUF4360 domain-containing protein n=1 Tax=Sorangium sp. So ce1036 TaxID=3133328 RepID=UPI003F010A95
MNERVGILSFLAALSTVVLASTASAQAPEFTRLQRVEYRGSACPAGTATIDIVDGKTAFLVTYDVFQAQVGPGIPLTESSKFCNLLLDIEYPKGWTFTVANIAYRGNATLQRGVSARFRARYNFPGERSISDDVTLRGPMLADFELNNPLRMFSWAPCTGRATLIATGTAQLLSRNPDSTGLVTTEQTDGKFKTKLNLRWRRCSGR